MTSGKRINIILKVSLLLTLLYFPLFLHLERLPMKIWDEARLAVSACEMNLNGNYIVTYFDGSPEMWSTKPPLMIWIQMLMIKIMGVRELAIRLPSALAAFFTAMLLLAVSVKYLKSFRFGFISALVLVTSYGYVHHHGTRTGDYDSLLTLWTTIYCISFYFFIVKGGNKFLHVFFIALTLAVLTKSIQGLLFVPALGLYCLIFRGKVIEILKNKWLYIDLFAFIAVIGGYYLTREHLNPGYLHAVSENELGGRFMKNQSSEDNKYMYYFNNLIEYRFTYWFPLLITGFFIGVTAIDKKIRNITLFSSICGITYLLIISIAKTKLEWYDLPLYPFLSILVTITIFRIIIWLKEINSSHNTLVFRAIPFLFLIVLFFRPYEKIIEKVYNPSEYEVDFYRISDFLRILIKDPDKNHTYDICYDNFDKSHILFYMHMLRDKGKACTMRDCRYLKSGDKVIAIQDHEKEFIEKFYSYDVLETYYNIKTYRIKQSFTGN